MWSCTAAFRSHKKHTQSARTHHARAHAHTHARACTHMQIHTTARTRTHTRARVHTHTDTHDSAHTRARVHTHSVRTHHAPTHTNARACTCTHTHTRPLGGGGQRAKGERINSLQHIPSAQSTVRHRGDAKVSILTLYFNRAVIVQ